MGYLTVVVIRNDALHAFAEDPKLFGEKIIEGIHLANRNMEQTSVGFKGYCNYIDVHPSRHADHETLYMNSGNCVTELSPYTKDFKRIKASYKSWPERMLKTARSLIKMCADDLKKDIK